MSSPAALSSPFNPLVHPICLRLPVRSKVNSAWTGHFPLAMYLIDVLRPEVFVELGTHWGFSYCAFCQAVKELHLSTACFAVDTWKGDPHTHNYGPEVLADLRNHHNRLYSQFSILLQSSFDQAVGHFAEGSIDLLHIDGYHSYEAVRHDFETWLPKMSRRGVVLLHDISVRDPETFGVWRFWKEVRARYPYFEFEHSHGLGVLAIGTEVPEGLEAFVYSSADSAAAIRAYFCLLGKQVAEFERFQLERETQLQEKDTQMKKLRSEVDLLRSQLHYFGHLRFRAVDYIACRLNRIPLFYNLLRRGAWAVVHGLKVPEICSADKRG